MTDEGRHNEERTSGARTSPFTLNHGDLARALPAHFFLGPTAALRFDAGLRALAVLLGADGLYDVEVTEQCLRRSFSRLEQVAPSAALHQHRILANIRRWSLEGLERQDVLAELLRPFPSSSRNNTAPTTTTVDRREISAKDARLILANAFVGNCVDLMEGDKYHVGGLDFRRMLGNAYGGVGCEKITCLLLYFDTCSYLEGTVDDERNIVFERIVGTMDIIQDFKKDDTIRYKPVGEGIRLHDRTMEEPSRPTTAFVNFANENFGYGTFIDSCTQEEILQMCCPEFNVGMLFIGRMASSEVINVQHVKRFSQCRGYLGSCKCTGKAHHESIATILVLDACTDKHFSSHMMDRDLLKAYLSFHGHRKELLHDTVHNNPTVSTGKWGCGAFMGLPAQKFFLQAVAASLAGVDLEFSTFGEPESCDTIMAALANNSTSPQRAIEILHECTNRRTFVTDVIEMLSGETCQPTTRLADHDKDWEGPNWDVQDLV